MWFDFDIGDASYGRDVIITILYILCMGELVDILKYGILEYGVTVIRVLVRRGWHDVVSNGEM